MFEINLVPDVKAQVIKAQKMRNLILFICIVAVAVMGGVVAVLGGIKAGQDIAMSDQDTRLKALEEKVTSFDDLDTFITVQNQLGQLSTIAENRTAISRVFEIIGKIIPNDGDEVTISTLNVDLEASTLNIEAQADAKTSPDIDYRVLEAFEKSVNKAHYDYGNYVTKEGTELPSTCINATDKTGYSLKDSDGNLYAEWQRSEDDCNPDGSTDNKKITLTSQGDGSFEDSDNNYTIKKSSDSSTGWIDSEENEVTAPSLDSNGQYAFSVIVYRTPQFSEWYKDGHIDTSGNISGVPHFQSNGCAQYTGTTTDDNKIKWSTSYSDTCRLLTEDIAISDSANGRDADDQLVLTFSASMAINQTVFNANSKYVTVINPDHQNATDSYLQIAQFFGEKASSCSSSDSDCKTNTTNSGGN